MFRFWYFNNFDGTNYVDYSEAFGTNDISYSTLKVLPPQRPDEYLIYEG
jgi:hypothetical protein